MKSIRSSCFPYSPQTEGLDLPLHPLHYMVSEMIERISWFLLTFAAALVASSRFPLRKYNYVNVKMSWSEARQFCRQNYTDLATFESMEEVQQLEPSFSYTWAWIGLLDRPTTWRGVMVNTSNSWRWSSTGETSSSGFQLWSQDEPDYGNREETCVLMDADGLWRDKPCSLTIGFVCVTETDTGRIVYNYVSTPRSWSDAQIYCRQLHRDLATIESSVQNSNVFNAKATAAEAWIGLYREPWAWSDNSLSPFRNWRYNSPNGPSYQHCVTENEAHEWDDEDCLLKRVVICQTVLKLQSSMRVIFKTTVDMTHPFNNAQIVQLVEAELKRREYIGFRLTWRIQPIRQSSEHTPRPQCNT